MDAECHRSVENFQQAHASSVQRWCRQRSLLYARPRYHSTRSLFSQSFYTQQLIGAECHLYTSAWPDHCAGYPVCCMAIATCEELSESGAAMVSYRHLHDFSKKPYRNSKVQIYHDECGRFRATWLTTKAAVSIWTALGPTTL